MGVFGRCRGQIERGGGVAAGVVQLFTCGFGAAAVLVVFQMSERVVTVVHVVMELCYGGGRDAVSRFD